MLGMHACPPIIDCVTEGFLPTSAFHPTSLWTSHKPPPTALRRGGKGEMIAPRSSGKHVSRVTSP
jgi:hypothetical protein